jgi:vacuolar-type H+-ATPase subunit I/STV1
VELQNKFYMAEGYDFIPLSFKIIDRENTTDDEITFA